MSLFTIFGGESAVLRNKGRYKQVGVYLRHMTDTTDVKLYIFVKDGNSYIRLYADGVTSVPQVRWDYHSVQNVQSDKHGRLYIDEKDRPEAEAL